MNTKSKKLMIRNIKTSLKAMFAIAYWITMSLFTLVFWGLEGASLGITFLVIALLGYIFIVKMTKFFIKRGREKEAL